MQPQSPSLLFGFTVKYGFENEFSLSITLPQNVCQLVPKVRVLMWEMNTGLQVEMSPKIRNFSRQSLSVHIIEIRITSNIRMKKKNITL